MYKPLFVETLLNSNFHQQGDPVAIEATVKLIERLEKIAISLDQQFGNDAKENILRYADVEYGLKQILTYHTHSSTSMCEHDYNIFLFFVINKLNQAERILDEELELDIKIKS